jgi:ERCC4-related helicase
MTILNLQNDFRTKCENGAFGADMMGAVFQRTSALMSLIHAKKLLLTHGYESFTSYLQNYMDITKKDKKNIPLIKSLKETKEYKALDAYIEETIHTKNHPKLCKLAEILIAFFSDPLH